MIRIIIHRIVLAYFTVSMCRAIVPEAMQKGATLVTGRGGKLMHITSSNSSVVGIGNFFSIEIKVGLQHGEPICRQRLGDAQEKSISVKV